MAKKTSRPFRLENGFGSVVKLSGHRRKPYAAKTATEGYDDKGHPIRQTLGYFETWQDAYECLLEYNKNPYDVDAGKVSFADIYDMLMERKTKSPQGLKENTKFALQAAYKKSEPFFKMPMQNIKTVQMQKLMDELTEKYKSPSLVAVKSLWHQMFELAEELDIVQKNYAKYVNINKAEDSEHSVSFTREEIDRLWSVVDTILGADMILVMIYTGFRISAYKDMTINLEQGYLIGGVKTSSGKNRIVPIHHRIMPLVEKLIKEDRLFGKWDATIREAFKPTLLACGIDVKNHTPHDCRATLATELQKADAKDLYIKRILGHSTGDLTKDIYTTVYIDELRKTIELIP